MVTMDYEPTAQGQESYILCADCGTVISAANGSGLCKPTPLSSFREIDANSVGVGCLRNSVDITEGIPKESTLSFCRGCERFASPPTAWVYALPESRELLGKQIFAYLL